MRSTRRSSMDPSPGRLRLLIAILLLALAGAGGWWLLRAGDPPTIDVQTEWPAIGRSQHVRVALKAPETGLGPARLEIVQGDHVEVLDQLDPDVPGVLDLGSNPLRTATLEAEIGRDVQPWLGEGTATLRVKAAPWAGLLRSPEPVVVEQEMAVRLAPPRLEIISSSTAVRQGGTGAAVLRVGPHHLTSGVETSDHAFGSFAHPSGRPDLRLVLFAIPRDAEDASSIRAFAVDDAGQRAEWTVPRTLLEQHFRSDTITLDDRFLDRVVPAIEARTPSLDAKGTLVERYLAINRGLRGQNGAQLEALAETSGDTLLAAGAFEQLPHSAVLARFGEERDYVYGAQVVDHQVHLGLDLASTAGAPVPAANRGVVAYSGWLGIYGNAVLVDHGLGLMSLYGHLSSTRVESGLPVERGDILGATGQTGLAGGDHLHFEVLVDGRSVNPVEWLDGGWVQRTIVAVLESSPG